MSEDTLRKDKEKAISLKTLKPDEYHLWVAQTEATLELHDCLNIVLNVETDPTPPPNPDGTIAIINAALKDPS